MRFELNYQANLTAWGAAACMRLWRITDEEYYLQQSYVYLASFFHNCAIWESEIAHATHYDNFLGATCLHDAPYMAIYECFDSFAAFERYLKDSGPDLDPAARLLVSEYCKYALDRAWYYYPDALPGRRACDQDEIRNGHIDRKLSFPLEDLYVDGQPAGQVGQEIYGAGAAFVFATRAFHNVSGAPFRIFCDHFPATSERTSERSLNFRHRGRSCPASASSAWSDTGREKLPDFTLRTMAANGCGRAVGRRPRRISHPRERRDQSALVTELSVARTCRVTSDRSDGANDPSAKPTRIPRCRALRGKRAIITGGTTGIGRAIAVLLASEGAEVFICGRDPQHLEDALARIREVGEGRRHRHRSRRTRQRRALLRQRRRPISAGSTSR